MVGPIPRSRFDLQALRQLGLNVPPFGGFLEGVDRFDRRFFGISPREAEVMDPQQRLLLEVAWDALEDANLLPAAETGVFLGMISNEYAERLPLDADLTVLAGGSRNAASGRLSYLLGLRGPSLVFDTDRSSSLVAVLEACRSLQRGDCAVALAGGSNLILSPRTSIAFARAGALAADGLCKFADARADGFVRSEGVALIVLKRLEDAVRDGDRIYATLLGGAVNNNGAHPSDLMRTSPDAQRRLLEEACRDAAVSPGSVTYVEAHGTGTPAGDPVELNGLGDFFGAARAPGDPLRVGSIKTNLGHLEAAAGIAGLIKAALALRRGTLPASLHFSQPNPEVRFEEKRVQISARRERWPQGAPRLAGVSSFGLTGTNAHLILSGEPEDVGAGESASRLPQASGAAQLIAVSAHTPEALGQLVSGYLDLCKRVPAPELDALAFTAARRRKHHAHRAAFVARSVEGLRRELTDFLEGGASAESAPARKPKIVFVCSGQGSQWVGMGRELLAEEPVFAAEVARVSALIEQRSGWSVLAELKGELEGAKERPFDFQPTLFTVSVALAALWRSWGIQPDAVVGASMGEVAAAVIAGALSLEDGVCVICERSRLMLGRSNVGGAVLAVEQSAEQVAPLLAPHGERAVVGVYSSHNACVLSGDLSALEEIEKALAAKGVGSRRVKMDIASHSYHVDSLREPLLKALEGLRPREGAVPMLSTVELEYCRGGLDAAYWARNLRQPVRLSEAVDRLLQEGHDTFLELSPHPVLLSPIRDNAHRHGHGATVVASLRRDKPAREALLESLAQLYVAGCTPEWPALQRGESPGCTPLPRYPWQRESYWLEAAPTGPRLDLSPKAEAPPESKRLEDSRRARRRRDVGEVVLAVVARVLGVEPSDVPAGTPLRELGLTSAMGIDVCERVGRQLGLAVPPSTLYRAASVGELTRLLEERLRAVPSSEGATTPRPPAAPVPAEGPASRIAIVGIGCRYPGGVVDPETFWQLLAAGRDAISALPKGRWPEGALPPDVLAAWEKVPPFGGFLDGVQDFDGDFFSIAPRELLHMDPQQRLLLEVAWEALERAGETHERLAGSRTGVFVGIMGSDYARLKADLLGRSALTAYDGTGDALSVAAGRVSYMLGLRGPAVTIDTACSSSLVAVHAACRSLRSGECDQALAGGVNLILAPDLSVVFSEANMLAPDGRCKSFDAAANGYVRSEGCGVIALKRYEDAVRDGNPILAVIRGSAVNQDGRSNGLTAPSGEAQAQLLRDALADARVSARQVGYVEAHGTGTPLGDPVEVEAIASVLGKERSAEDPLWIGSVKSNFGHAESAAGIAGLIKAVLCLRTGEIPASLHFQRPNPQIPFDALNVRVAATARAWERKDGPRLAGVSSFGFSGTNAHVLVEEGPAVPAQPVAEASGLAGYALPLLLSARSPSALCANAGRLADFLERPDAPRLVDLAYSLALTRAALDRRLTLVLPPQASRAEAAARLREVAAGRQPPGTVISAGGAGKLAVLFTGQGSQRLGMGRQLYAADPTFREHLDQVCKALNPYLGGPLQDVLFAAEDSSAAALLHQTAFTQPALFAIEVALYRRLEDCGVRPDRLLGHSIGELVAAHVAGVLSLEGAARLVCARGSLMQGCPPGGAMASIAATEDEVLAQLRPGSDIAGLNGPTQTVVSGEAAAVDAVMAHFRERGRKVTRLKVSHAFHSPLMEPMLEDFANVAATCSFHPPQIPIVSNVTGRIATDEELASPDYWKRHARRAVRFLDGVRTLAADGVTTFLECGPGSVLGGMVASALPQELAATILPTLGEAEVDTFVRALCGLHGSGYEIDWGGFFASSRGRRVELPTYAFQRKRYWLEAKGKRPLAAASGSAAEGELWAAIAAGAPEDAARVLELPESARAAWAEVLPHVAAWRTRGAADQQLSQWLYDETWEVATSAGEPASLSGTWLVVAAEGGGGSAAASIVEALRAAGAAVVELASSSRREELCATLKTLPPLSGIVSLIALGEDAFEASAPHVHSATLQTVTLLQALADAAVAAPLWLLTRGAVWTGARDTDVRPLQSLLWGVGRAFSREHPERRVGLVDLSRAGDRQSAAQLLELLSGTSGADEAALRPWGHLARRIVRAAAPAKVGRFALRDTVLITGGTGALGRMVARWSAERGARHLVLTSRRGAQTPDAAALKSELEALGATVTLSACDLAERDQVEALLREIDRGPSPLRAVFHLAGLFDARPLKDVDLASLSSGCAPKVSGALHLDALLGDRPLDALVLFGSITGFWGAQHGTVYGAANAFLEGLARQRRARGLAGSVLHWGPWDGGGIVDDAMGASMRRLGLRPMDPTSAVRALDAALCAGRASLMVCDVDWSRFGPVVASIRASSVFTGLEEVRREREVAAAAPTAAGEQQSLRAVLLAAQEQEHPALVRRLVTEETAAVLGAAEPGALDARRGFSDLGLDSLMAVQLRQRLARRTGLPLPATLTFDHPNIDDCSRWLLAQLLPQQTAVQKQQRRRAIDSPVAIIGVGLRMPGGARDLDSLFRVLKEGVTAAKPIPPERFDLDALVDPDPDAPGTSSTRYAALLDEVSAFDAGFFGVSPREATPMDPQHRLLLESAWEALENAGIPPGSLKESRTGVFIGIGPNEYESYRGRASEAADAYDLTGSHRAFSAGRVAYHLGLQGPALAIDTACSSSLVALHVACDAVRRGQCTVALAAGVQILADPRMFVLLSRTHALAPDGRSKTFSDAADGYGRGEGVGVLALMRLSEAEKAGHRVLGVIHGTAVNQDGASSGITAPSGPAQQKVLEAALENARLTPADVDVVECHGTGTSLGDPIEVQALAEVYGRGRGAERPLLLGAAKATLGHLESAAGIAGVLKILAAFRHNALPPTVNTLPRNRHIDWERLPVRVVDELTPWARGERPRRAGVSAFGFSGTNAHVILEEPPRAEAEVPAAAVALETVPLVVSGRTEEALRRNAARLAEHLAARAARLVDVSYSLATRRTAFEERMVLGATDAASAIERLKEAAAGALPKGAVRARAQEGRVVFLYPGQGSQSVGMCRSLLKDAAFRADLEACDAALRPHTGFSVVEVLEQGEEAQKASLAKVTVVQPLLWAVAVALTRLWERWGVKPAAVVGHSQGEVAAAVVAGALTLEEGARVVAVRSRLVAGLSGDGAMASVGLPVAEVEARLKERKSSANVAVVNSKQSTAIAGERQAVEALVAEYEAAGVFCRRIAVDYASHSPQVDPALPGIREELKGLKPSKAKVAMYSTVTGGKVEGTELSGSYWADNLRKPVRLDLALEALGGAQETVLLEVSAHPVLSGALGGTHERVVASLRREGDAASGVRLAAAELHTHGVKVAWEQLFEGTGAREVELPTYAFERQRYWLEIAQRKTGSVEAAGLAEGAHPLSSGKVELPDGGALFTGLLEASRHAWMEDHQVFETVLVPGVAMVELAAHAAKQLGLEGVLEAVLEAPLALEERGGRRAQLVVGPLTGGTRSFALRSQPAATPFIPSGVEGWTQHATGQLGGGLKAPAPLSQQWPPPGAKAVDLTGFYERLKGLGFGYGRSFQALKAAWAGEGALYAEVELSEPSGREAGEYGVHPALFDGALHAVLTQAEGVQLPFAWSEVQVHAVGATSARVKLTREGEGWKVALYDALGQPVASVGRLQLRPATAQQVRSALVGPTHLYEVTAQATLERHQPVTAVDVAWLAPRFVELPADGTLLVRWPSRELGAQEIHEATKSAVAWLQGWLKDERLEKSRVVWLTQRALCVGTDGAGADLSAAAVWGVARTAQAEHPDRRLVLLDVDGALPKEGLDAVLSRLPEDEPQLVLRHGQLKALRLAAVPAAKEPSVHPEPSRGGPLFRGEGTVLITGGTGGLAGVTARHLVESHGAKHLLLLSRTGPEAPGAKELVADLQRLGAATVEVRSCDVSDFAALKDALARIPAERPLVGVFHLAFTLDDGVVTALGPAQIDKVLLPKVDGALHLHALTRSLPLSAFVLYSGAAGTLGNAGQANYAAANLALDALAAERRRQGLPATSLAWGTWAGVGAVVRLGEAHQARLRRSGFLPLAPGTGMRLLDLALASGQPNLVPVQLDLRVLQRRAEEQPAGFPAMLRSLVRAAPSRAAQGTAVAGFVERLRGLTGDEQEQLVAQAIRQEIAAVLRLEGAHKVESSSTFKDLGFDSLMAVELRNRVSAALGVKLPVTVIFDHPSARRMTDFVLSRVRQAEPARAEVQPGDLADLRERLAGLSEEQLRGAGLLESLLELSSKLSNLTEGLPGEGDAAASPEKPMTREEMQAALDAVLES